VGNGKLFEVKVRAAFCHAPIFLIYNEHQIFKINMSSIIRWGILGCGKIANKFANDLKLVEHATLAAVASRDKSKAQEFATQYNAARFFTTYEELVSDKDVDVIYIATPHGLHYEHAMLCLKHHKAVLCEKAFALNSKQANEMIAFAREQKVFIMEAFWTKFLPQYKKVIEIIQSGVLGEIRWIQADFGFNPGEPVPQRLVDPLLGGGSLLDIGIYPVFLAQSLLGKPVEIQAAITPTVTGVDEQCAMLMKFSNGAIANLSSTLSAHTPVEAVIAGTEGRIMLKNRFHNAIGIVEVAMGKDIPQTIDVHREDGYGYQFEARHVGECLRSGLTESPVMTHQDTLQLMDTLDRVRKIAGIQYTVD
jgi:predicted dehydrogenase